MKGDSRDNCGRDRYRALVCGMPQSLQELYTTLYGGLLQWHQVFQVSLTDTRIINYLLLYLRVVPDFIVQGGDPTNTGTGGENPLYWRSCVS